MASEKGPQWLDKTTVADDQTSDVRKTLVIDSRDLDTSQPFSCTVDMVHLNGAYCNVASAELKALVFPKIADEMYVNVDIRNMNSKDVTYTDIATLSSFATVLFDSTTAPPGTLQAYKGSDYYRHIAHYTPPISLNKLHISFTKHGGTLVTPSDTGGQAYFCLIIEFTLRSCQAGPGISTGRM